MESFHLLLHTHWDLAPFVPEDATAFPLSAFRFPLSAFRFSPTVHGENEPRSLAQTPPAGTSEFHQMLQFRQLGQFGFDAGQGVGDG